MTVTHIAGLDVTVEDRYLRQRCAWCGTVLLDYDLTRVAVPVGTEPRPATWPPSLLVRVDGNASYSLEPDAKLPGDACTQRPEPIRSATYVEVVIPGNLDTRTNVTR